MLVVALVVVSLQLTASLVGAQGGTWVSGFTVQNQDQSNAASVTIKFYWAEGTPNAGAVAYTINDSIPAGKSRTWFTPNIAGLPDGFIGSVVVESSTPVAAIINTQVPSGLGVVAGTPNRVGTASGVLEPQTTMYVTQILKARGGWNSYIAVQNTTADTASVTVHYYDDSGADVSQHTESLHPYSTYVFRLENESALAAGFFGSAKIESAKNIAVICNFYNDAAGGEVAFTRAQFHSYNAFGATPTATKLFVPRVVKDYYGYQSGLKVQNVGNAATTVTVQYKIGGSTYTQTSPSIGPGQSWGPYMGSSAQLPAEMAAAMGSGSAIITSAGQPVVATINEDNRLLGRGATYNAFLDGQATTTVLFPQVTARFYGYCSGIQIQNVSDQDGTLTVVYSMSGRPDTTVSGIPIAAGASWSQFVSNASGMGSDFNGSAVVTCNRNIVGIANMSHRSDVDTRFPPNFGDSFTTYNGINK
jgi:hypothetical protein